MATEVIFPRVDMDMKAGRLGKWLAQEGSAVRAGEPLFEIETDKAAMEIEAPAAGVLRGVRAAEGEEVAVGASIAWIVAEGETWAPSAGAARPAEAVVAPAEAVVAPANVATPRISVSPLRATPLARREATRRGIDLSAVRGSGPRGRVLSTDLPTADLPIADLSSADLPVVDRPAVEAADAPVVLSAAPSLPRGAGRLHRTWRGRSDASVPIVFLHGFGADHTGWRPLWGALEAHHALLGLDLPGHGRSPAGATSLGDLASAVRDTLVEERRQSVHLVGHSLGAAVAIALAEMSGIEARSLTLLAPAGLGPEIDGAFIDGFLRARSVDSLSPWLRRLFADPPWVTPGFARAALETLMADGRRAAQAALAEAVFPDGTQAFDLNDALARISVPVKVIWGRQDRIIPYRHSAGLPPLVALHSLPGVGHMPHLEAREIVASLIGAQCRGDDMAPDAGKTMTD